jgi:hypothetical protein
VGTTPESGWPSQSWCAGAEESGPTPQKWPDSSNLFEELGPLSSAPAHMTETAKLAPLSITETAKLGPLSQRLRTFLSFLFLPLVVFLLPFFFRKRAPARLFP